MIKQNSLKYRCFDATKSNSSSQKTKSTMLIELFCRLFYWKTINKKRKKYIYMYFIWSMHYRFCIKVQIFVANNCWLSRYVLVNLTRQASKFLRFPSVLKCCQSQILKFKFCSEFVVIALPPRCLKLHRRSFISFPIDSRKKHSKVRENYSNISPLSFPVQSLVII